MTQHGGGASGDGGHLATEIGDRAPEGRRDSLRPIRCDQTPGEIALWPVEIQTLYIREHSTESVSSRGLVRAEGGGGAQGQQDPLRSGEGLENVPAQKWRKKKTYKLTVHIERPHVPWTVPVFLCLCPPFQPPSLHIHVIWLKHLCISSCELFMNTCAATVLSAEHAASCPTAAERSGVNSFINALL